MGLRSYRVTRGEWKGESAYASPPTFDLTNPTHQRRMVQHHVAFVSFFVEPNFFVCDGHIARRKGPRSKYNQNVGTVFELWPHIFDREAIAKLRATPKGKAKKRTARKRKKS